MCKLKKFSWSQFGLNQQNLKTQINRRTEIMGGNDSETRSLQEVEIPGFNYFRINAFKVILPLQKQEVKTGFLKAAEEKGTVVLFQSHAGEDGM